MGWLTMRNTLIYGVAALIVMLLAGVMAYSAWFVLIWGFNPLGLYPLYAVGLLLSGATILVAWMLARK